MLKFGDHLPQVGASLGCTVFFAVQNGQAHKEVQRYPGPSFPDSATSSHLPFCGEGGQRPPLLSDHANPFYALPSLTEVWPRWRAWDTFLSKQSKT